MRREREEAQGKEKGGVRLDNESGTPPSSFAVWMPDDSPRAIKCRGRGESRLAERTGEWMTPAEKCITTPAVCALFSAFRRI